MFLLGPDNKWSIRVGILIIISYVLEEGAIQGGGREEAEVLE